ncbi:Cellulose binding domain [Fragilaria crotonensis]|nr:Cellulose binding domain [Fragilaria crotonensis]
MSTCRLRTENYVLQIFFNSAITPLYTIALTGTVPAGGSFVIANNAAAAGISSNADQTSDSLAFNGDDAVVLRKGGTSGTVVDSYGQVGVAVDFGTNKTYRKKSCGIRDVVTTDVFDRTVQYDEFVVDTFDGLRSCPSGCSQSTSAPTGAQAPVPTPAPTESPTTGGVVPTASPTASPPAAGSDLAISEYIEGTSNNKVIELCNPSSSTVDLLTDGYLLQIYFNGAITPLYTIALTGTVPAGGSFVIANNAAAAGILSNADQTSDSLAFNGNDAVVLRKGGADGTVVDSFGQVGVDADFGTDKTYRKKSCGIRDVVTTDVFDSTVQYDEFVVDTFDGLKSCPSGCGTQPTASPTAQPTASPTASPTAHPTRLPTKQPSRSPTTQPTRAPTAQPTSNRARRKKGKRRFASDTTVTSQSRPSNSPVMKRNKTPFPTQS